MAQNRAVSRFGGAGSAQHRSRGLRPGSSQCGSLDVPFPARSPSTARGPGALEVSLRPCLLWAQALCVKAGARLLGVPPESTLPLSAVPEPTQPLQLPPRGAATPGHRTGGDTVRPPALSPYVWNPPSSPHPLPSLLEPLGLSLPRPGRVPMGALASTLPPWLTAQGGGRALLTRT